MFNHQLGVMLLSVVSVVSYLILAGWIADKYDKIIIFFVAVLMPLFVAGAILI